MKRRTFVKNSSLTALSISAFGSIRWNGKKFVGNNPTTTDILGPFYRPNAPIRKNLILPNSKGIPLVLRGTIFKEDGNTPVESALVEIWHCDENQVYDNTSDNYNYRGGQKINDHGNYEFNTIIPVPYQANPNDEASWRPAHIHMRVSVPNQQDLITQIYFSGGKYVDTDKWASSPQAANRILEMTKNSSGNNEIIFDVVMTREIPLDNVFYDRLTGLYDTGNNDFVEFLRIDDMLYMKRNGQLRAGLNYIGNNTFEGGNGYTKATFELQKNGSTNVTVVASSRTFRGTKYLKY